jgi:hypothetical protein
MLLSDTLSGRSPGIARGKDHDSKVGLRERPAKTAVGEVGQNHSQNQNKKNHTRDVTNLNHTSDVTRSPPTSSPPTSSLYFFRCVIARYLGHESKLRIGVNMRENVRNQRPVECIASWFGGQTLCRMVLFMVMAIVVAFWIYFVDWRWKIAAAVAATGYSCKEKKSRIGSRSTCTWHAYTCGHDA